jgi:hypothetical protein
VAGESVKLAIELIDDGQPAQRPQPPEGEGTPSSQPQRPALEGESPEDARGGERGAKEPGGSRTWLDRIKQGAELFEGAARRLERFSVPLAGNDFLAAFRASADSASDGLAKLGPYGQTASVALQSLTGVVESMGSVTNAFIERGKQLAQFSPELSASNARAEMSRMFSDMAEAEALGGDLSRLQDSQTALIEFLKEAILPLKKWIISTLGPMVETFTATLQNFYIIGEKAYGILQPFIELVGSVLSGILNALGQIMSLIDEGVGLARARREKFGAPLRNDVFDEIARSITERAAVPLAPLDRAAPLLGGAIP